MRAGSPSPPSAFHVSQGWPDASMNGAASMEPAASGSQTIGLGDRSTNGPAGDDARAAEMQRRPGAISQAV
jgi:hypothetical protein